MSNKRLTGADAKVRRGAGWSGKGSAHPTAERFVDAVGNKVPPRYSRAYRGKDGRDVTRWVGGERQIVAPHQSERERMRRRAGGMRNVRWLENAA